MKQANNNEVDILLRSLARARPGAGMPRGSNSGDGNRVTSDHLDADELNTYAEGMAPAPARARYTEHLADCDLCRGIVVNLTQAAGIATHPAASEQKEGLTFWQKLGTLFSPPVLRFAVPALVLTAVIGIGLLAMRQQRGNRDFVAKNEPALTSRPEVQLQPRQSPAFDSSSNAPATLPKRLETPAANEEAKGEKFLDDRSRLAQETETRTTVVTGSVAASKDAGQPAEAVNRLEPPPPYAPEPKAAAAPTPGVLTEVDKTQLAKERPAKLEDRERQQSDSYKNPDRDEHGPNRSPAPTSAGAALSNRRLDGPAAGRGGPYGQDKKDKAGERANEKRAIETRTISGRRFVREDKGWVDTAYDSSRTPIRVSRGSEQFRGLIADEPGLRAIAEQLNGVVIVVWKNRAYRIQ